MIEQTKFWPHETTRTIKASAQGGSSARGTSRGEALSHTTINTRTEAYLPEQGLLGANRLVSASKTSGGSLSRAESRGISNVDTGNSLRSLSWRRFGNNSLELATDETRIKH